MELAGTYRTQQYLLTNQFQDGQAAGSIVPGRVRDFIVSTAPSVNPLAYGTITDGGTFGDGLSHPASSNGFATLAAIQAIYKDASFTATGSGTNLTISSVTGSIQLGRILVGTGIPTNTTLVSQTSGTTGGAGVYVTSGSTTASAASVISTYASATSNDMAGLMIQAAINGAHASGSGAPVFLPPGRYYNVPLGLSSPPFPLTKLFGTNGTTVLCSPCGTNPSVTVNPLNDTAHSSPIECPFQNIAFWGMDTVHFSSQVGGGAPDTSIFNAGSQGMHFISATGQTVLGVKLINFDLTTTWDSVVGSNWNYTFRGCDMAYSNKGACINGSEPNSFERMMWDSCGLFGNNYGFYINLTDNATIGVGNASGSDVYIHNCSIDYNLVQHGYYIGGAGFADDITSLYINQSHLETNSSTSGLGVRITHNGNFVMTACECFENSANPSGLVNMDTAPANANSTFIGCKSPGYNASDTSFCPFVVTSNGSMPYVFGYGNTNRVGSESVLISHSSGVVSDFVVRDPSAYVTSGSFTPQLQHQFARVFFNNTTTLTLPAHTTTNFAIGTVLNFTIASGFVCTIAAAGGVTLLGNH